MPGKKASGYGGTLGKRHEKVEMEKRARRRGPRIQADTDERTFILLAKAADATRKKQGQVIAEALELWMRELQPAARRKIEGDVEWEMGGGASAR